MRRLIIATSLAVGTSVLYLVAPLTAAAAEMELPSFTVATPVTATSGVSTVFQSSDTLKCKHDSADYAFTAGSLRAGTFTAEFRECTTLGEECHSLGDKVETVLVGGEWELVLFQVGGVDRRLIWWKYNPVHLECKFLSTLLTIRNSVLGEITGTSKTQFSVDVHAKSAKEQEFKEFENSKGEDEKEHLEAAVDEGSFEEAALEDEETLKTEKETELID